MPNPVLRGFGESGVPRSQIPTPTPQDLHALYNQPTYVAPPAVPSRYMTLDDVVIRTGAMIATVMAVGAATWILTGDSASWGLVIVGVIAGFALAMYISLTGKANAVTSLLYAGFEGLALGGISKAFEQRWNGIVVQALIGTLMVAVGVLVVYKTGAIRVTPRFTRIVAASTIGLLGLMIVNAVAYLFTPDGLGLRAGGGLAIVFSLVCIVVAALNLVIDFDVVEQGIRHGADEKFAWYASFGILVTLVWLYLEILRLLANMNRS
jgi:uncharacterized YccA/Bax inhibitor family protein